MTEPSPASPQIFHCPNCGAALPDPTATSVTCQYCGTRILVPPEYLPKEKLPALEAAQGEAQPGSPAGLFIGIAVFILGLVGIIFLLRACTAKKLASQSPTLAAPTRAPLATPVAVLSTATLEPFANLLAHFGGQGSGPGQFDDSRFIDVDQDGNLYVADYIDGRVQKLDPSGKFVWLVNIPPKENGNTPIRDLVVTLDGRVYVARSPDILVYNPDGSLSMTIRGDSPTTYYEVLDIDPSNTLFALHSFDESTSLVKMNTQGETLLRVDDLDSQLGKHNRLHSVRMAVDGLGNIYLLNGSGEALYLFDPNGQFRDILVSKGEAPGQLNFSMNVAVDGQGRIYLINNSQIQVLDAQGSFLKGFDIDYSYGSPFDLALDLEGNLYLVTSSGNILKYRLALGE